MNISDMTVISNRAWFQLLTNKYQVRNINIPDPSPLLTSDIAIEAAGNMINSDIFDPNNGPGTLTDLIRIDTVRELKRTLF